ncbi:hypothetical protein [Methyloversatilis sp. XJ19-49]|uniref:hypothetical protein n=1 Tax=Methyloversatilis sp. XJ19-49 TaxID=2963429 RepID=UPI00211BAA18|nr:hypothetical protein [Methyloversatilis sp. XJ19-49]MCQ9377784.1 hypothetical protein [Methyloversatilis sp. XJ19-49]
MVKRVKAKLSAVEQEFDDDEYLHSYGSYAGDGSDLYDADTGFSSTDYNFEGVGRVDQDNMRYQQAVKDLAKVIINLVE